MFHTPYNIYISQIKPGKLSFCFAVCSITSSSHFADVKNIISIQIAGNSEINHEPIEKLELIGFKKRIPTKTALKYGLLLTDKQGEVKIKKADFDSLSIFGFKNITNKVLTLKNSILPDSMKITLFFNSTNFCQFPTFDYYKDNSVYFIKKGKLIADDVDYIMQSPF